MPLRPALLSVFDGSSGLPSFSKSRKLSWLEAFEVFDVTEQSGHAWYESQHEKRLEYISQLRSRLRCG